MTNTASRADRPPITIGMPVCNGERFLRQALDCWLAQDFRDFELILSDDASTDSTSAICLEYAARDMRIRYIRSEENRGAVWNFNYVFGLADTEFFAWAAQDDWWHSSFLRECLTLLRSNSDVAGVHPRIRRIDANGQTYAGPFGGFIADQDSPVDRFSCIMSDWLWCFAQYGIWRTETLRKTKLFRKAYSPDHVLVGEAALYGKILEVPEILWAHRTCNLQETTKEYNERVRRGLEPQSKKAGYRFPLLALTREHLRTVIAAPLTFLQRLQLAWAVMSRFWVHQVLAVGLRRNALRLFGAGRMEKFVHRLRRMGWYRKWRRVPEGM